ncbi:MAG: hypothetical protein KDH15_01150 [Rhodocyclaceae bacterium]|nr:hypothetical protein [Rhodocyclaceae bacterium]
MKFSQVLGAAALATTFYSAGAHAGNLADVEIWVPRQGDHVGIGGRGYIVDLGIEFDTGDLDATGFNGLQITGPGPLDNVGPHPGTFSPGRDDRMPGLVVLLSTTTIASGPGTNLANLFNVTGVTRLTDDEIELWDTWIIGAPNFGRGVESTLYVAVVADLDGNGKLDDAPDVVPDSDGDGDVDKDDLEAIGLASNVERVTFFINE